MKTFRLSFGLIILFIFFFIGLKKINEFNISRDLKKEQKLKLEKTTAILNECFDLKNKSKRTLNDSIKLIEYCLKEYGSEK